MRNGIVTLMILLFALPVLGAWMPHGVLQSLHNQQEMHHQASSASHHHEAENGDAHAVHFDPVTYYSDYLHADLMGAGNLSAAVTAQGDANTHFALMENTASQWPYPRPSIQSRAPPDIVRQDHPLGAPVYLATQRLRI